MYVNPPKVERERKFRCRLCTSSVQREVAWAFSGRSCAVTAKKCTKKREVRAKLLFWLLKLLLF